ncbi:MAG: hypothetical protein HC818_03645 [Synechococcaceae cyanobacterium RM1_1_27]|nr:hypothetical protein [Synechococcaceae cyanobacterium RM1_1_27]
MTDLTQALFYCTNLNDVVSDTHDFKRSYRIPETNLGGLHQGSYAHNLYALKYKNRTAITERNYDLTQTP